MRVLIDGVVFENSHQRGVQRYFREMVARLPADIAVDLVLGRSARCGLPERARPARIPAKLPILGRAARRRRERGVDVFHSSYFTVPATDLPSVVTVHDMIVERYTEFFHNRWADEEVRRKRLAIESAGVLIAGSRATASELAALYPRLADRIVVVYYGADHIPESEPESGGELYVLYVGDRGGYKNFRCVLEAMASPAWPRGLPLRIVGPEPRENERMLAQRMAGDRARFLGRVEDGDLNRLYRGARATIVASLVEGFGFPVLEAQRAGSRVVCSDIEVFREIAGDTAVFFDPRRPEALAGAVAAAMECPLAQQEAARVNARRFTWQACAEMTAGAYRRAAAVRPPHSAARA